MSEDQPHLFDTQPPAWEQDAAQSVCVARVVLPRRKLPASLGAAAAAGAGAEVEEVELQPGDYVAVHVTAALSPNTLRAAPLAAAR